MTKKRENRSRARRLWRVLCTKLWARDFAYGGNRPEKSRRERREEWRLAWK